MRELAHLFDAVAFGTALGMARQLAHVESGWLAMEAANIGKRRGRYESVIDRDLRMHESRVVPHAA